MNKKQFSIAILLPTRGRTDALKRSVISIINRVVKPKEVQLLLAFDNDDEIGTNYFVDEIQPWLDQKDIDYTALTFDSMGYEGLNRYYNSMAEHADADWLFVWNDDAIMETAAWDNIVRKYDGEIKILKVHTHDEHPYSIFPIIPVAWFEKIGYLSKHQMIDAELSQLAYMLDLIEIVDIYVTHDRADLTGNNKDETDAKRVRYEGNPSHPLDFHHVAAIQQRMRDTELISQLMKSMDLDISYWEGVQAGTINPWKKMQDNDPNGQTKTIQVRTA
jgi:hypothetical protein